MFWRRNIRKRRLQADILSSLYPMGSKYRIAGILTTVIGYVNPEIEDDTPCLYVEYFDAKRAVQRLAIPFKQVDAKAREVEDIAPEPVVVEVTTSPTKFRKSRNALVRAAFYLGFKAGFNYETYDEKLMKHEYRLFLKQYAKKVNDK
jgi:hypothetical protein